MISQNQSKFIRSLHLKKFREENKIFIAEGEKSLKDLLSSELKIDSVYATRNWIKQNTHAQIKLEKEKLHEVSEAELKKISTLVTPNEVLALLKTPQHTFELNEIKNKWTLVLDEIKDPGNFGTIIRTADWFGINTVICSENSVELYNPKVIQATMGSFCRVKVHYMNLEKLMQDVHTTIPIIGTTLSGENIFKVKLPQAGLLVFGNESKGISEKLIPFLTQKIRIPSANTTTGAESLNVSVATGIVCSILK